MFQRTIGQIAQNTEGMDILITGWYMGKTARS